MVNGGFWNSPDVPFGGYRQSGLGRENGRQGFEEYLETKALAFLQAQWAQSAGRVGADGQWAGSIATEDGRSGRRDPSTRGIDTCEAASAT